MAVVLANLPHAWAAEPSLLDYGGDQAGAMGGAQARFVRLGSRWQVKFTSLAALKWVDYQPLLAARLTAHATGQTVIAAWPQPALSTAIGAPAVNGAGQAGGTLVVNGLSPGAALPAGLFFSVVVAGRNYLYQLGAAATADGGGNATLTLSPWLRAAPATGAALNFAAPQIEGFMAAGVAWAITMRAWVSLPDFVITEVQ